MVKRETLVTFMNTYLRHDEFREQSWNGLQFEGREEVRKILFAVDAGGETFERAAAERTDMIVVHHGHFWNTNNPSLAGWNKRRIDILYRNNISLYASHLPLDGHPVVGNNAQLLKLLGAKPERGFCEFSGRTISYVGSFKRPQTLARIVKTLESRLGARCTTLPFGPKTIRTMAVVSGGGSYGGFSAALGEGVDLYLTGDAVEIYHVARDSGMNVVFGGHHATETLGVKALADVVRKKCGVEALFVDLPTGL